MIDTKIIADSADTSSATSQNDLDAMLAGLRRDMRPAGAPLTPLAGQRCGL